MRKVLLTLTLFMAPGISGLNAVPRRLSADERILAAVQIKDLARRFKLLVPPLVGEFSFDQRKAEAFLANETDPAVRPEALNIGQMLFLHSIADPSFGKQTVQTLMASYIGGNKPYNTPEMRQVIGHNAGSDLDLMLLRIENHHKTAGRLKSLAARQLAHFEAMPDLYERNRANLELLYDEGRTAWADGETLVQLSGTENESIDPHYGYDTERGFGLLKTTALITPERLQRFEQAVRARSDGRKLVKRAFQVTERNIDWSPEDMDSDFELGRMLVEFIIPQLFSAVEMHEYEWGLFLIHTIEPYHYPRVHAEEVGPDFRRAVVTLSSADEPPATTYYTHKARFYKVPLHDALAFDESLMHLVPKHDRSRFLMIVTGILSQQHK